MPFTYLPHQAAVLPIKLRLGRLVAGTALVAGSVAPDVEYFLRGRPLGTWGHTAPGQLFWSVPVALLLTWLAARVLAPGVAPHLPDCAEWRLRDWRHAGARAGTLRYWLVAAPSAWAGAWTHLAWDWFTHDYGAGVKRFPALMRPVATVFGQPLPGYGALWLASTILGALATLWMARRIGRERLLARWAGAAGDEAAADPAETARVRRELAWAMAASLAASVLLAGIVAPPGTGGWWMAIVMRILILPIFGAGIVGALALLRARRAAPLATPGPSRSASC
jgi:hypothetical protein